MKVIWTFDGKNILKKIIFFIMIYIGEKSKNMILKKDI